MDILSLRAFYSGLYLPVGLEDTAGGRTRRERDLQLGRECAADRLDCLGQDGGGLFSHPDPAGGGAAPQRGSALHRAAQGPDQRPVRPSGRAVRRSGDPGHPLARRCAPVPQEKAHEKARRDPPDHAGVPGISDDQQTYGDPVPVPGSPLHCDR